MLVGWNLFAWDELVKCLGSLNLVIALCRAPGGEAASAMAVRGPWAFAFCLGCVPCLMHHKAITKLADI